MFRLLSPACLFVWGFFLLTSAFFSPARAVDAPALPDVAVTIAPVHSLVAGVMEHTGAAPRLVFPANTSPHGAHLSPSQISRLAKSDVVIWVGPDLEDTLTRHVKALPASAHSFQVTNVEGLTTWPQRAPGVRPLREAMHFHTHASAHGSDGSTMDPHVWLDPRNAQLIVWAIADRLGELFPDYSLRYQANAQAIVTRLSQMDSLLFDYMKPLRDRPYVVFHDAYQYTEHRYGLLARAAIALDPSAPPGARRLADIRSLIRHSGAVCLFHEPQFGPATLSLITEGLHIRTAALDPLGARHQPGPNLYARLIADYSDSLARCLGPQEIGAD